MRRGCRKNQDARYLPEGWTMSFATVEPSVTGSIMTM